MFDDLCAAVPNAATEAKRATPTDAFLVTRPSLAPSMQDARASVRLEEELLCIQVLQESARWALRSDDESITNRLQTIIIHRDGWSERYLCTPPIRQLS